LRRILAFGHYSDHKSVEKTLEKFTRYVRLAHRRYGTLDAHAYVRPRLADVAVPLDLIPKLEYVSAADQGEIVASVSAQTQVNPSNRQACLPVRFANGHALRCGNTHTARQEPVPVRSTTTSAMNNHQGVTVNHRVSLLSAAIGTSLVLAALPAFSADLRTTKYPIDGQYIVVLKEGAASLAGERSSAARVSAVARNMAGKHRARVKRSFEHALRGFVVEADDAALAQLLADPNVAYIEEDGVVTINATQTGATWGIDRIDQRDLPLSGSYTYDTSASGVHVYVIDTGLLTGHTQFTGRVGNGFRAIADDGRGTSDCNGHGTHVAGTVGGTTYGVAKGVTVHPVRVFGCGNSGSNSDTIAGIDWVAQNRVLPAVANMSLGGGASQATDDAVNRLIAAGVVAVVAAGNSGTDACLSSPARVPNAITVGSTASNDARSIFNSSQSSSWGSCLDIFAPGSSILSAGISSTSATATLSGTSMASPHVAGVAALYLANNPTATPAQVTTAILNNATPNKVTDARTGSPNRLLYSIFGGTPPPPPTSQTYTNTADFTINDNATVNSPITVSGRTGNGSATTPVAVNIVHTYIADLKVDLVAPDGSVYVLHNRTGGSADNIVQTYTVNLSSEALNGTWNLRVNDNANADTGFINSWSVTF
jgi:serine protease